MKRGCTYGTILVDLESRQPVELLDSRETADVAAWLTQHPGIEVVSRDRGSDYIKAANLGAPQAEQVADHWHLLKNLREAVEPLVGQEPHVLTAAGMVSEKHDDPLVLSETQTEEVPTADTPIEQSRAVKNREAIGKSLTGAEQKKAARHARKQARFELVKQLHQEGHSKRAIQRHLGISGRTVNKYMAAESCPLYTRDRLRPSKLTPRLPYLEERWQTGYTNATQL